MKRVIVGIVLLLASTQVLADNCERPRNTFDSLYCARKVFFELDDALNATYKELRSKLTSEQKGLLKKSQLGWIDDRDSKCTVRKKAVVVSCAVRKTRERLTFLENRLFECNSVGCIDSKLSLIKE